MDVIGIICEYNPFHNGHIYHTEQIKKLYPNSIIVLVLNGYFLERGEISFLTKEDKVKIALDNKIDLVLELPVIYGTQAADIFAQMAIKILNAVKVNKIIFGSETNDIKILEKIALRQLDNDYDSLVRNYLKEGINYPTALAKAIDIDFDFNNPNDLLAISYIKAIKKNNYNISYECIKRTNSYHDLESSENIISASNIRNKYLNNIEVTPYLPKSSLDKLIKPNYEIMFKLLKSKIMTTKDLSSILTIDEGIENRLVKYIKEVNNIQDFQAKVKTKRYTFNKINRMFIHLLLGITKIDAKNSDLDYIKVLGFNKRGQDYLNKIKDNLEYSLKPNVDAITYKYEIISSIIYDLINDTKTYEFEIKNKPIKKL